MLANWSEVEPSLDHWIDAHEGDLVNLVQELVRYPSVSTGLHVDSRYLFGVACARLADASREIVEGCGLVWQNHDYFAISATYRSSAGDAGRDESPERPRIAFYSHLDVVPAGSEGWDHPPFEPYEKDGWIYGRGSTDNKGPFASVLLALRFLAEQGVQLNHDVTLFGGFDEEVGMDDAKWIVEHIGPARFNLVSDCSFPVCVAEKGILEAHVSRRLDDPALLSLDAGEAANAIPAVAFAEVIQRKNADNQRECPVRHKAVGRAAHAAFPEGSENALVKLAGELAANESLTTVSRDTFAALSSLFATHDGQGLGIALQDDFLGSTTCVPTVARYENGVLRVLVNVRYPAASDGGWVRETFAKSMGDAGFEIDSVLESPARDASKDSALVQRLTNIVNEELQSELHPYSMGGATHARWIPGALGFGPGRQFDGVFPPRAGSGHEANEAVSLLHLEQATKIYVRTIIELDAL